MTIDEIRNLIEEETKTMLIEEMEIKEHNIYILWILTNISVIVV